MRREEEVGGGEEEEEKRRWRGEGDEAEEKGIGGRGGGETRRGEMNPLEDIAQTTL